MYFSHIQVFDFAPNPNVPLVDSNGIIEISPSTGMSTKVEVPTDTQTSDRYWIIGSFNGLAGLDSIDILNTISPG